MLKVTIELQETEDERINKEAILMLNAGSLAGDLFDFKQMLRSKLKYSTLTEDQYTILEEVQSNFLEIYHKYLPDD